MDVELQWVPRRSLGIVLVKVNDTEFQLTTRDSLRVFEINQTGALIWQLCDDQRTIEEIISLLQDLYPEAADSIPDQTATIIGQLLDYGVLYSLM